MGVLLKPKVTCAMLLQFSSEWIAAIQVVLAADSVLETCLLEEMNLQNWWMMFQVLLLIGRYMPVYVYFHRASLSFHQMD